MAGTVLARGARLIPAHAGKTMNPTKQSQRNGAHPRACGENSLRLKGIPRALGSSPRMRGKLGVGLVVVGVGRLIPAHAGKTSQRGINERANWAHPRACGENFDHDIWLW